jgi:ABC-type transport system involved in cytochrome c biogenesis ATPase subunit
MSEQVYQVSVPAFECKQGDARSQLVKTVFGLTASPQGKRTLHANLLLSKQGPAKGLIYITGFSGSGKSCLLREIALRYPGVTLDPLLLPEDKTVINCFDADVGTTIQWLGRFGLSEALVLLTPVHALSVGQRERLRLALLLWQKPAVVILDEFLASLDRVTARVIAFQFQKVVRKLGTLCFVATAHSDLEDALFPNTTVHLDFEGKSRMTYLDQVEQVLPETKEIQIEKGTLADYEALKRFHYMDAQAGEASLTEKDTVLVQRAVFRGMLVGVRVFTKVYPTSFEQHSVFAWINSRAVVSARVVVHPAFRGLGVSRLMDFPFAAHPKVLNVFTHSALARYFPFDCGGGYEVYQHPSEKRSDQQARFEFLLRTHGHGYELTHIESINDPRIAAEFWNGLSSDAKSELRQAVIDALTDYDVRNFYSILKEMAVVAAEPLLRSVQDFFSEGLRRLPDERFAPLLSEALFFPMRGLVRRRA